MSDRIGIGIMLVLLLIWLNTLLMLSKVTYISEHLR